MSNEQTASDARMLFLSFKCMGSSEGEINCLRQAEIRRRHPASLHPFSRKCCDARGLDSTFRIGSAWLRDLRVSGVFRWGKV